MDEEDDESAVGATKYPVMPSLLSLQQMRNRLHLSYLGKKLMKWTAMATGRELRKLAVAADLIYRSFYDDVSQAYMLLARCRYFCPSMNEMVLQNVGNCASVRVIDNSKAMTGVKVVQFDIVETGIEPYTHLGLEKGGQQIHEAKLAWLGLLKRLILMLELRTCFVLVETANRNANTRMNVMNKVAIPRTKATIHYILIEMEEMAREELYRIKITKKKKVREAERAKREKALTETEESKIDADEKPETSLKLTFVKKETSVKQEVEAPEPELKPILMLPAQETIQLTKKIIPPPIYNDESRQLDTPNTVLDNNLNLQKSATLKIPPPIESQAPRQVDTTEDNRIKYLKVLLSNVIALGKEVVHTGLRSIDIDEFLNICDEAKMKINNLFLPESNSSDQVDPALRERLNNLKTHLREVVNITNDFKNSIKVTRSVENFIESCEEADNKLNLIVNADGKEMVVNETSTPIKQQNIRIKDTNEASNVKNKAIPSSKGEEHLNDSGKLKNLTEHVCELEKMSANFSTGTNVSGIDTNNLENLSIRCKDFRDKLEAYKNKVHNSNVSKLLLTEFPSDSGSFPSQTYSSSENINKFLDLCENLNKIFDEQSKGTENFNEVYNKLDYVIKLLRQFKDEGIQSPRLAEFLRSYEKNVKSNKKNVKSDEMHHEKAGAVLKDNIEKRPRGQSQTSLVSDLLSCSFDKEEGEDSRNKNSECYSKTLTSTTQQEETLAENDDNALGLFEKTMKKIVRVTRTLNEDGSIREETQTIIIKKSRHDPANDKEENDETGNNSSRDPHSN